MFVFCVNFHYIPLIRTLDIRMDRLVWYFKSTVFISVLLFVCVPVYVLEIQYLRLCAHESVLPGGIIMFFLCRISGHLSSSCQMCDLSSSGDLHRGLTNWFNNNLFLFRACCLSFVPTLVSLPWLPVFSFPHCAVDYSSCFSWFCFLCHMTNPEEFWFSLVISLVLSDSSFIWYFFFLLVLPPNSVAPTSFLFSI